MKYLSVVVSQENADILQELAGYCLYRKYPFQRLFVLTGMGGNGKGTFIHLLEDMLGKNNASSTPLKDLEDGKDKFASSGLFGKMANISADDSTATISNIKLINRLTGGDKITAQFKGKDSFEFYSYSKIVVSLNDFPEVLTVDNALAQRFLIVDFPVTIRGTKLEDKTLGDKLKQESEVSGFLNWALDGLKRLLEQQTFSHQISTEETAKLIMAKGDPITAFVEEFVEFQPLSMLLKEEVYARYVDFCRVLNVKSFNDTNFSRAFRSKVVRTLNLDDEGVIGRKNEFRDEKRVWLSISWKKQQNKPYDDDEKRLNNSSLFHRFSTSPSILNDELHRKNKLVNSIKGIAPIVWSDIPSDEVHRSESVFDEKARNLKVWLNELFIEKGSIDEKELYTLFVEAFNKENVSFLELRLLWNRLVENKVIEQDSQGRWFLVEL